MVVSKAHSSCHSSKGRPFGPQNKRRSSTLRLIPPRQEEHNGMPKKREEHITIHDTIKEYWHLWELYGHTDKSRP